MNVLKQYQCLCEKKTVLNRLLQENYDAKHRLRSTKKIKLVSQTFLKNEQPMKMRLVKTREPAAKTITTAQET